MSKFIVINREIDENFYFKKIYEHTFVFNDSYSNMLKLELSNKLKSLILLPINKIIINIEFLLVQELKRKFNG